MTVSFELDGQEFTALNGGPAFKFTEAVSFVINCDTQEEIDYYWEKLTAGDGEELVRAALAIEVRAASRISGSNDLAFSA